MCGGYFYEIQPACNHRNANGGPSHATGISALVEPMALAATACGADGLMIEVHNDPMHALCDGAQSLTPEQFENLSKKITAIREVIA